MLRVPDPLLVEMLELEAADAPDWDRVVALATELQSGIAGGEFGDVAPVVRGYLDNVQLRRTNRQAGAEHFAMNQVEKVSRYLAERQAASAA